jgi:hypothetical protein
MSPQEFVDAIKIVVSNDRGKKIAETFENPPGRKGAELYKRLSPWFKSLPQEDKELVIEAMQIAAEHATFRLLTVLDGAAAIEPRGPKGDLELYFVKDGSRVHLNALPLHELY